jgi:hypothetical protein
MRIVRARQGVYGGLLLLVLGDALLVWRTATRPRVTKDSIEKVELDMTRAEVEAILGGPPGFYDCPPDVIELRLASLPQARKAGYDNWYGQYGGLRLKFDERGRVCLRVGFRVRSREPSFFDRVRAYLGL